MRSIEELRSLLRDRTGWDNYFKDINELLGHVAGFNSLLESIRGDLSGATLGDLFTEQKRRLLPLVLGGFNVERKRYEPRSLGLFYRLVGLGVRDWDLDKFASRIKEGDEPIKAGRDIRVYSEEPFLPSITRVLESQLRAVVDSVGLEARKIEYKPGEPKALLEALAEVLNKSRALLPLYNRYSFIIQSLNSTPALYLSKAYNISFKVEGEDEVTVGDNNLRSMLDNYNIRLRIRLAPDIENEKERLQKAVIGHENGSLGHRIMNIIGITYALFTGLNRIQSDENSMFLIGVTDEYQKYANTYNSYVANYLENLINIATTCSRDKGIMHFEILDGRIKYSLYYYGNRGYLYCYFTVKGGELVLGDNRYSKSIQFAEFLEPFSPLGFLGLASLGYERNIIYVVD